MSRETDLAEETLGLVANRADAEVTATSGNLALTRFANSFIHQNVAEEGESVSLRVAVDGRVASATTTRTDSEPLAAFVDATLETAALQTGDETWPGLAPPAAVPTVDHTDDATYHATAADRAAKVESFVDAGGGLVAAGYCETEGSSVAFVNSAGQHAAGRITRAVVDGIHQTGASAGSGHAAGPRLSDLDAGVVGAQAAARARDSETTFDAKPGEYEVVLAPECVGTIAVFIGFYGFNAKAYLEGQSFAEIGVTQFDERFQMWDDVTDPRALGVPFDREGTPKGRTDLAKDGVTVGLAHDRRTAKQAGVASTGHFGPGSDIYGPFATNVFVGGGHESVDALISGVERGLYVSTFNYCRVLDPKTLVVTGLTRNGTFMIENGKITGAVSNLRFTQSFVDALGPGRVLGLGDDARFADSEFATGIMYTPSLRLASWNFTGGVSG